MGQEAQAVNVTAGQSVAATELAHGIGEVGLMQALRAIARLHQIAAGPATLAYAAYVSTTSNT